MKQFSTEAVTPAGKRDTLPNTVQKVEGNLAKMGAKLKEKESMVIDTPAVSGDTGRRNAPRARLKGRDSTN